MAVGVDFFSIQFHAVIYTVETTSLNDPRPSQWIRVTRGFQTIHNFFCKFSFCLPMFRGSDWNRTLGPWIFIASACR